MANELYPVFLKANKLHILVVGGGFVGLEKMSFLLKSSPKALITLVSLEILPELQQLIDNHKQVIFIKKAFESSDLSNKDLVIAATSIKSLNVKIQQLAKEKRILINVADTPELCDFYLGGVVTKGDLKIAISTNGQSPTLAKRIREMLEEAIPENINDLLENLNDLRKTLKGDFESKVRQLNEITKTWNSK
jgi:precorrin-2 dehydrogenase/sirohydrochlorin ferrochelatase